MKFEPYFIRGKGSNDGNSSFGCHNVSADDLRMMSTVQSWMGINRWWVPCWASHWKAHWWEQTSSWKVDFKRSLVCGNWVSEVSNSLIHSRNRFSKDRYQVGTKNTYWKSSDEKEGLFAYFLTFYHSEPAITQWIVMGDKTWIHHIMLITMKQEYMEWKH